MKLILYGHTKFQGDSVPLIYQAACNSSSGNYRDAGRGAELKERHQSSENASDEKLETHVRNGSYNFLLGTPEVWMKNVKWLQIIQSKYVQEKGVAHCS